MIDDVGKLASIGNAFYALLGTMFVALLGYFLKKPFMKKAVENEVFKTQMQELREGFLGQIAGWKTQCDSLSGRVAQLESQRSIWEARANQLENELQEERSKNRPWPIEPDEDAIIVLAEDENAFANTFKRMMERLKITIFIVTTGFDALKALRFYPQFKMMVLDFGLPDIDGVQVAVQARREGFGLPIIGLSGTADYLDRSDPRVIEAGFAEVLPKTARVADVSRHVLRILAAQGEAGGQGTDDPATSLPT